MNSNVGDGAKKLGERLVAEVEVEDLSSVSDFDGRREMRNND
jgi:hypothetical protein